MRVKHSGHDWTCLIKDGDEPLMAYDGVSVVELVLGKEGL